MEKNMENTEDTKHYTQKICIRYQDIIEITLEIRLKKGVGELCEILMSLDFDHIYNKLLTWSNMDLKSENP
ncbi:hypothetical protein HGM15179_007861 [Zosterops borbonicus]|uniref:Uncharacterized protein n=1 Tax=Zosterops borbonicus TaxID=364589 RepID=A0A8K1GI38_9PASS|nr:hypothetical protein HGM15179_007861 [Zosterops borbonicus]